MQQALQRRSIESQHKVMNCGEILLRKSDEFTIAKVVAESSVSVGAIYARFNDKKGLLTALIWRFMRETESEFEQLDMEHWKQLSISQAVDLVIDTNARIYHTHRGVLRALVTGAVEINGAEISTALSRYNATISTQLQDLMLLHADKICHPQPTVAIKIAIDTMTILLRDKVLVANRTRLDHVGVNTVKDVIMRYLIAEELT